MLRKPLLNNLPVRTAVGFLLAAVSPALASWYLGYGFGGLGETLTMVVLLWLPALLLTARYTHKYPQRYYTYLLACHFKGAMVMVFVGLVLWLFGLLPTASPSVFWLGVLVLVVLDFLISLPNVEGADALLEKGAAESVEAAAAASAAAVSPVTAQINTNAIKGRLPADLPGALAAIVRGQLPAGDRGLDALLVLEDIGKMPTAQVEDIGVLVGCRPLNNVSRLNNYLAYCTNRIAMGGYIVASYQPMEVVLQNMKGRYPGWLYPMAFLGHFIRYRALPKLPLLDRLYFHPALAWFDGILRKTGMRRDRALTKAEVWGRLAYYGMEVFHESEGDGLKYVVAQRVANPVANRKPSYYAVVALEKVGLGGKVIRLHKVRSMYPFSEFLQKKIFQSHGLTNTGKFKNDFRLTDYGPMIRKNWIDEIPGILDWMRGDVKLVGMRATSPHYLSLYPKDVYQLYIQVKPGLVPPIFNEETTGFDQIVEIERTYLTRYLASPIKTDILYFWYTFRDIFIRRVRSS